MLVWGESAKPTKRKVYGFVNGKWVVKHQQGRGVSNFPYAAELPDSSSEDSPWVSFDKKHPMVSGRYLVYWPRNDGRPYYATLYYNTNSDSWPGVTDPENIKMWYDAPLSYEVKEFFALGGNFYLPMEVAEPKPAKKYNHKHNITNNKRR